MKKHIYVGICLVCSVVLLAGCGKKNEVVDQAEDVELDKVVEQESETYSEDVNDAIAQAIAMEQESKQKEEEETARLEEEAAKLKEEEEEVTEEKAEISLTFPGKYALPFEGERGTVELITYEAKDYVGNGDSVEKKAYVYLPAGYDESKQYNVLYLMHGIGGNEKEWGLNNDTAKLKRILDRIMGEGSVEPFILVTPNGKALACEHTQENDPFYLFGLELRNDLIPYMESHYATYAEYDEAGYDMSATRTHRAMAGLSMGGMQTINIGIGECLDLFSYFGAFSAAPTSDAKGIVAKNIEESEYTVDYFYNICGTEDTIAFQSASAAAKDLPAICEKLVEGENYLWHEKSGGHDFGIWYLGIYNFSQLAFSK